MVSSGIRECFLKHLEDELVVKNKDFLWPKARKDGIPGNHKENQNRAWVVEEVQYPGALNLSKTGSVLLIWIVPGSSSQIRLLVMVC